MPALYPRWESRTLSVVHDFTMGEENLNLFGVCELERAQQQAACIEGSSHRVRMNIHEAGAAYRVD